MRVTELDLTFAKLVFSKSVHKSYMAEMLDRTQLPSCIPLKDTKLFIQLFGQHLWLDAALVNKLVKDA